jgi:pre-mRNA-splicing factor ISY1
MARPAEKARAMLNKWVAMREGDERIVRSGGWKKERRPHLASECEHLADAERFRGQIVREIADKIAKIQNPAQGEHAIRELNDEINRLFREQWHWNRRIHQLGGLDYNAIERKRRIEEGDTQLHSSYRYFGAAKELPGVKELLEKEEAARLKVKRTDGYKHLTPDYYGWRDEEDGVLLELEEKAAKKRRIELKKRRTGEPKSSSYDVALPEDYDYLAVPSQEEVAKFLLEHKKKELIAKLSL